MDPVCAVFPDNPLCQLTVPVAPGPVQPPVQPTQPVVDVPVVTSSPEQVPVVQQPTTLAVPPPATTQPVIVETSAVVTLVEPTPVISTTVIPPPVISSTTEMSTSSQVMVTSYTSAPPAITQETTSTSSLLTSSSSVISTSVSASAVANAKASEDGDGIGGGAIAGIVFAGLIAAAALAWLFALWRKNQKRKQEDQALAAFDGPMSFNYPSKEIARSPSERTGFGGSEKVGFAGNHFEEKSRFSDFTASPSHRGSYPNMATDYKMADLPPLPYGGRTDYDGPDFPVGFAQGPNSSSSHSSHTLHDGWDTGMSPPQPAFVAPKTAGMEMNGSYPIEHNFASQPLAYNPTYSGAIVPQALTDSFPQPKAPRNSLAPEPAKKEGTPEQQQQLPNPYSSRQSYGFVNSMMD